MQRVLTPDSRLVTSQFSAAAVAYDKYAGHHRLIAEQTLDIVKDFQPGSLLELGCGTGILSVGLNDSFPEAVKVFTDGAEAMVEVCRKKIAETSLVHHKVWDFEKTPCDRAYDLVISSCALQWLCDRESFVRKLCSLITPAGVTVHAIPVKGMLTELETSFCATGKSWNSLNYISGSEWDNLLFESGFEVINSFTRDFTIHYNSPADVLRAIRGIGASLSSLSGSSSDSPGSIRKALGYYQSRFGDSSGFVPATYSVHFVTALGGSL